MLFVYYDVLTNYFDIFINDICIWIGGLHQIIMQILIILHICSYDKLWGLSRRVFTLLNVISQGGKRTNRRRYSVPFQTVIMIVIALVLVG